MTEEHVIKMADGTVVNVVNGKVTKIEGRKGHLAPKEINNLEGLYHPDRLQHPLKRIGDRGKGQWQQISWDEALDTIAQKLVRAKEKDGPESVAMVSGYWKEYQDVYLEWLADTFGTPNFALPASVCMFSSIHASMLTYGFFPQPDYGYPPGCAIIWGRNPSATGGPQYHQILDAKDKGTKLIVIDPMCTDVAAQADLWLQPRPGSDMALALAMTHVIVTEGLYDRAFVDQWTVGFDRLKTHIQDYPPEKVAEITWIDAETIKAVARLYATQGPAVIAEGNPYQNNINSVPISRVFSIMRAITGNLGRPGGEIIPPDLPVKDSHPLALEHKDKIPPDKRHRNVSAELNLLPIFPYAVPQSIVKAILEQDPYPIRTALIKSSNPLLSWSNSKRVYEALNKLDFLVVVDLFMTPTAVLADIVLPSAGPLEYDNVMVRPSIQAVTKVAQVGERWSCVKICIELAKKLGLGEHFPDNEDQHLDSILEPAGLTFEALRKEGLNVIPRKPRSYESEGFQTPSGKVELYSAQLKEWGCDPLPIYHEPPETPLSAPDLAKEYPLIATSYKSAAFMHSDSRQIPSLRESHPEPITRIHPETARELEIKEGDWVFIETRQGRIKQKALITEDVDPRMVSIDYGWWFPERGASEMYGWAESNINVLTDDSPPYNQELGSARLRPFLCKVYKFS